MTTKKIIFFTVAGLVVTGLTYMMVRSFIHNSYKSNGNDPDKPKNDIHKGYDQESFPLVKGMYGEKIRRIRAVLNLTPSDLFDSELENLIYAKFKVKQVTESDYNFYNNPNVVI